MARMAASASSSLNAVLVGVALSGVLATGQALAGKADAPIPEGTLALMAQRGTTASAPVLLRVFKKESELEVWKRGRDGRFALLKTFPICRWSGQLGPKLRTGDRQTPEGFYSVGPRQMNPNSRYYLSFDTGYPNAYDRAHGGTGSALMVHGTCSSMGCYAMTDRQVGEIFSLVREAFAGGQAAFQFQAFPFRMSAANMARYRTDGHMAFWRQLKEGSDRFEATGEEPAVGVRDGRYVFEPYRDPLREAQARARLAEQSAAVAALVAAGSAAYRTTYADGGQHPSFRLAAAVTPWILGEVSRPEALALAGREVVVIPARKVAPATMLAAGTLPHPAPRAVRPAVWSEPSVFAWTALGYRGPALASPGAAMSGSVRIVPPDLTRPPLQLAVR